MDNIKPIDLTFVIQGPVDYKSAVLQVESIKRHYKESPIIISTWNGMLSNQPIKDVKIIHSEDPGGWCHKGYHMNINRQIISSFSGLKEVQTKYVIKLRSDLVCKNGNLLKILNEAKNIKRNKFNNNNWVVSTNLTTVNIDKHKRPFAICDWIFAGETNDIKNIFDIDLMSYDDFMFFDDDVIYGSARSKFNAEQYIIVSYLRKIGFLNENEPVDGYDASPIICQKYKIALASIFLVKTMSSLGFKSLKYKITFFGLYKMMTEHEWKKNYLYLNGQNIPFKFDATRFIYDVISSQKIRKPISKVKSFVKRQ
ncbi:WavE lipopolysaccharide synthesis family protein [Vibrio chagasii]|uniref:WavE lipopolysaccharide synthesis family protein n=1 Tax=Vibrio chagasii TaxID=170679 RepID=UPI001EFE69A7|nr:WavE lipopolysaccharide synthesis family protein [Vibrio chagasii]MCG9565854.1 WavE lipopolysaccharide synthesis family protein [Vibrio chagasii]